MVNQTSTGTAVTEFANAHDGSDLIPGNIRAVAAAHTELGRDAATLVDTATTLASTAAALPWSGHAADAFTTHTRQVVGVVDRWNDAHAAVAQALADHQTALASAQDKAGQALTVWQTARQRAAEAQRFDTGINVASNAEAVRSSIQAQLTAATRRAYAILDQARSDLSKAGDTAADAVEEALQILRDTPLPALHDALTTAPTTGAEIATSGVGLGWAGPTVTVQPPHDGIHDSLSRIAARTLGDPKRWPEIYQLNAGQPVGDHAVLHDPNLIQPGWTLRLPPTGHPAVVATPPDGPIDHHPNAGTNPPASETPPVSHVPQAPTISPSPSFTPAPGTPGPAHPGLGIPGTGNNPHPVTPPTSHATPAPSPAQHPVPAASAVHQGSGGGISLGGGLLLGGGVVAALGGIAAAVTVQHRYTAGHAASAAFEPGPVVRRLAADLTGMEPLYPGHSTPPGTGRADLPPDGPAPTGSANGRVDVPLGLRDGRTILIDAATTLGLGITGPGALPATRALLVSTLAAHPGARIVLAARDSRMLLPGPTGAHPQPDGTSERVTILDRPETLLNHLEAEILTRTRLLEHTNGQYTPPPLVVITTALADPRRLQAIADLGAGLNIIAVVLGAWPAGITCHVGADGRIDAADGNQSPDWTAALAGLQAFTAGVDATRELLALLGHRPPAPAPSAPANPWSTVAGRLPAATLDPHAAPTPAPTRDSGPQITPATTAAPDQHAPHDPQGQQPGDIAHRLAPDDAEQGPTDIKARLAGPVLQAVRGHTPSPRKPDSATTEQRTPPVHLAVVGRLQAQVHGTTDEPVDITEALAPRQRDIVVYLALHPDGVRRETLTAALWPDAPGDRPYNSFHATLSQMRRAVRKATNNDVGTLTVTRDGHYALDPTIVDVDLWHLNDALHAHRHGTIERERTAALHHIAELYRGDLADGVTGEWIEAPREALRRNVLDAVAALIRIVREHDPEHTLELLEQARDLDPHNEAIYRDILRTQARLGHQDSIPRTLSLLHTALAEVDAKPSADTVALATQLQRATTSGGTPTPHSEGQRPTTGPSIPARAPRRSGQHGT